MGREGEGKGEVGIGGVISRGRFFMFGMGKKYYSFNIVDSYIRFFKGFSTASCVN